MSVAQHIQDQQTSVPAWIETADGVVMELNTGSNFLAALSNVGGSEIDNLFSQGVNQHGATFDDYRFRPRVTSLELRRLGCGCYGVCAELITRNEPVICPATTTTFYAKRQPTGQTVTTTVDEPIMCDGEPLMCPDGTVLTCPVETETLIGTYDCGIYVPPSSQPEPITCTTKEQVITCLCRVPIILECDGEPLICDGEPLICGYEFVEEEVTCDVVVGMEHACCSTFAPRLYNGMYLTDHLRPNRGPHYLNFMLNGTVFRIAARINQLPAFGISPDVNGSALDTAFSIWSPSPFYESADENCIQWSFGEVVTCPTTGEIVYCNEESCDPLLCLTSDSVNQVIKVRYCGTWATSPRIKITGPIVSPVIENVTTGRKIELDYTLDAGETVWIDLENDVDNRYTKTIISSRNGDISGVIRDDTEFSTFALEPHPIASYGRNALRLIGSGVSVETLIEFCYRDRFIGLGA